MLNGAGPRVGATGRAGLPRRFLAGLARHWGLLLLLALGTLLRALTVYAYVPAFTFADSISYLEVAETGVAQPHRPWAYSLVLRWLEAVVPLRGVVVLQHLLGVLTAALVYALLQHRGVRRWVSCLAVVPLLLDAYVVQIEHYVMAESLYISLLVGALDRKSTRLNSSHANI